MPLSFSRPGAALLAASTLIGGVLVTTMPAQAVAGPQAAPAASSEPKLYVDPRIPEGTPYEKFRPRAARTAPLSQTFQLHSKPGAATTLFIDVDGGTVAGTAWNESYGAFPNPLPGWDMDGDGATFNDNELLGVQALWNRVAEDYAPFDIDVTTEQPSADRLSRTSEADTTYGTTAFVTDSSAVSDAICQSQCGGIAYTGVFGSVDADTYRPAWVFSKLLNDGKDPKAIAEALSHEVGHNLGLAHDGLLEGGTLPAAEYHSGTEIWGPIMGAPYGSPLTQWNPGDYAFASNTTQDDFVVFGENGLAFRPDDVGNDVAGAGTTLPTEAAPAIIGSRTDVDVFNLGTCSGNVSVTATPTSIGPNLDISLTLLNGNGGTVATANPATYKVADKNEAGGLDATITDNLASGTYYAKVDGAGQSVPADSAYSDYGSLGSYRLAVTNCAASQQVAPGAPTNLAASVTDGTVNLSWTAPVDQGSSPVTGYSITVDGNAAGTSTTTSKALTGLAAGQHLLGVRAVSAAGSSTEATTTVTVPNAQVAPGEPTTVAATVSGSVATLTWGAPASAGSSPISAYRIRVDTGAPQDVAATDRTFSTAALAPGTHELGIRAVSAAGTSSEVVRSVTIAADPVAPSEPGDVAATVSGQTATLTWSPPLSSGSAVISGYRVRVDNGALVDLGPSARSYTSGVLAAGQHVLGVRAISADGMSSEVSRTVTIENVATPPSAPLSLQGSASGTTISLTWQAPSSDGGAAITGYLLKRGTTTLQQLPASARSTTLTGQTPGAQTLRLVAVNSAGEGAAAEVTVTVAAPAVPAAPGTPSLAQGKRGGALTLIAAWKLGAVPAGGGAIDQVQILWKLVGSTRTATTTLRGAATRAEVKLPAGVWAAQVRAHNSAGWSAYSAVSRGVRPR